MSVLIGHQHSILLLNKPSGLTSRACINQLVRALGIRRIGHTGTLDPLATGMLPICIGEATKFARFFLDAEKAYEVTMVLGIKTHTADADGEVIHQSAVPTISDALLFEVLERFTGEILQTVPKVSAVRVQGKRLYEWSRLGIDMPCPERHVTIYENSFKSRTSDRITLYVRCSKGTYIRALVESIALALGTHAHVEKLHRCWVSPFQAYEMALLDVVLSESSMFQGADSGLSCLHSLSSIFKQFPYVVLSSTECQAVCQGKVVQGVEGVSAAPWVGLYTEQGKFLGVGSEQGKFLGVGSEQGTGLQAKRLLSMAVIEGLG